MNGNEETALSVIVTEARAKALKIIAENKDCISYVRPEDLETASLFVPVVTAIRPVKEDFYEEIPKIGYMPKPRLVNLLREKAGINIIRTDTSKRGEFIWVAHVYGEKRMPDGSMASQDASFEWNAQLRAEMDFLRQPNIYNSDVKKRLHILEYAKIGESRAVTGAQHVLIHKLALVARSFKTPQEMIRGMLVSRIDRNIDGLLRDPQMREAAINLAIGVSGQIYGPEKRGTGAHRAAISQDAGLEISASEVHEPPADDFQDDIPWDEKPEDIARRALGNFLEIPQLHPQAREMIEAMLADKDATLEAMTNLIERTNVWLDKARISRPVPAAKGGVI